MGDEYVMTFIQLPNTTSYAKLWLVLKMTNLAEANTAIVVKFEIGIIFALT